MVLVFISMLHRRGFTLIELLLVCSVLGVLVLGLLATIDPFEQIKKANDSTRLQLATSVYDAVIAVYAQRGSFPWTADIIGETLDSTSGKNALTAIVGQGALKENFVDLAKSNLSKEFLTATTDGKSVSVCFLPDSKNYKDYTSALYDKFGAIADSCQTQTCYICVGENSGKAIGKNNNTPTGTPTPTPVAVAWPFSLFIVEPTPQPGDCPLPSPTPWPMYPSGPNNYFTSPGSSATDDPYADSRLITRALEWYNAEHGSYPSCGCGWTDAQQCLQSKLAPYTASYPTNVPYRGLDWSKTTSHAIKYIAFDYANGANHNYCLALKNVRGIYDSTHWNQQCSVGIEDASYTWTVGSKHTIVDRKPVYGNVYSQLSSSQGSIYDNVRKKDLQDITNALEAYKKDNGHYPLPASYGGLTPYSFDSFAPSLVPKYLSSYPYDPHNPPNEPHGYDIWLSQHTDSAGYASGYCLMAYMDENTNCSNQCSNFPWMNQYGEAFCYYKQNP